MKEAKQKIICVFHLCRMSGRGKSKKTDFRLVVVKAFGEKGNEKLLTGCEFLFWNDVGWQTAEVLVKSSKLYCSIHFKG